jgi:hypothetical protein
LERLAPDPFDYGDVYSFLREQRLRGKREQQ